MKQTKKERKQLRESFRHMSPRDKVDYIFTYYKLPIFTACVVLALLISSAWRALTKKDPVLYVAYINVTAGETLDSALTDGYLQYMELDPKKQAMIVYRNLYITEDASVEADRVDRRLTAGCGSHGSGRIQSDVAERFPVCLLRHHGQEPGSP